MPTAIQPSSSPPSQPEFERLARLSGVEYDQARKAGAKRLNLRLRTLDEAVDGVRALLDDAEADSLHLPAQLGLIFDVQTQQANDYGYWRQGMQIA